MFKRRGPSLASVCLITKITVILITILTLITRIMGLEMSTIALTCPLFTGKIPQEMKDTILQEPRIEKKLRKRLKIRGRDGLTFNGGNRSVKVSPKGKAKLDFKAKKLTHDNIDFLKRKRLNDSEKKKKKEETYMSLVINNNENPKKKKEFQLL